MRAALATVPGVQQVEVVFDRDLAIVKYEKKDGPEQVPLMIAAIEGEGFKSWTTASEKKSP